MPVAVAEDGVYSGLAQISGYGKRTEVLLGNCEGGVMSSQPV